MASQHPREGLRPGATAYQRKFQYRNKAVAESYSKKRFFHPEGIKENETTAAALTRAFDGLSIEKILDIPCGTGRFTRFFCDRGYRYVGSDISLEMMEVLLQDEESPRGPIPLVQCDAEHLPFKDNAFDCIVSIRFLNHLPGEIRRNALREMRRVSRKWLVVQSRDLRVLGPGGRLKAFFKGAFGGDIRKYRLHRDILAGGWREERRVSTGYRRRYIGIYQK
jgi:SAM-dependent methyltransferase